MSPVHVARCRLAQFVASVFVPQRAMACGLVCAVMLALLTTEAFSSAPGDLVFSRKGGTMSVESMPPSIFPHWLHRIHYRCDACHNRLFEMELGATEISMDLMSQKKSCGTCHNGDDSFAINFDSCNRCHVESVE